MKKQMILAVAVMVMMAACGIKLPFKNKMSRSWKFSHMDNHVNDPQGADELMLDTVYKRFEYGYLSLYNDGGYTFLGKNVSSLSHWSFSRIDSLVIIDSFIGATQVRFKMVENTDKWLKMDLVNYGGKSVHVTNNTFLFTYDPYFEYADIDLMTYPRNTWRIRPSHKESHAEIKKRVMEHVDFMIAYFQMVEDDSRSSFRPMYLQSTMSFYANGVATDNEYELSPGWVECFYDHDDALEGWKMMTEAMKGMGPYPEEKTYTAGYLKALKTMREFMEKVK